MSLLYDSYGIRRVAVEVNLWPEVERFKTKDLSELFGALNGDGMFSSLELRPESGARFESDAWSYDLSPAGVFVRCVQLSSLEDLKRRVHFLLDGTRRCVASDRTFYTDEIRVYAHVPEGGKRDVEAVVSKKLIPPPGGSLRLARSRRRGPQSDGNHRDVSLPRRHQPLRARGTDVERDAHVQTEPRASAPRLGF